MTSIWQIGVGCSLAAIGVLACGGAEESKMEVGDATSALKSAIVELGVAPSDPSIPNTDEIESASSEASKEPAACGRVKPHDVYVAQLVKDSWFVKYPLTRLSVAADGTIVGDGAPDMILGDLEVINLIPAARKDVARAVKEIAGLPDYGMRRIGPDKPLCSSVPAITPSGIVSVSTYANRVVPDGLNQASWTATHTAFGKQCLLVRRVGDRDIIDPPGDGSTNSPVSATVSATGVRADVFGRCSCPWCYCKLSYATGVNYTGRLCLRYNSQWRCLPY